MGDDQGAEQIGAGTVIRTQKWGPEFSGTVVRRDGDSVFVAWHNSFVESEMTVNEVTVWPDAPEHLRQWRGGLGYGTPAIPSKSGQSNLCRDPNPDSDLSSVRNTSDRAPGAVLPR